MSALILDEPVVLAAILDERVGDAVFDMLDEAATSAEAVMCSLTKIALSAT